MTQIQRSTIAAGGISVDPRQIFKQASDDFRIMYITINPNANKKHDVHRKYASSRTTVARVKHKVTYGTMTHAEQYTYLCDYFDTVYSPLIEPEDRVFIITERTELNNNLHFHVLFFSPSIQSDYDLNCFRKTVQVHPYTLRNKGKDSQRDYMNNIVFATNPMKTFDEYFTKQDKDGIKKHYPDQVVNIS